MWLYFDVKNGIEHDKVVKASLSDAARNWALQKYCIHDLDGLHKICVPGFGEGILAAFSASDEAQKKFVEFTRGAYWKKHFSPWVNDVLDFIAGAERLRA